MKPAMGFGLAVLTFCALMGCSGGDESDRSAEEQAEQSVFDPMTDSIDRAREVEQDVNQRIDDLNRRIEEGEGS